MSLIPDLEWSMAALHMRDLLYAYILALPIGWDREKHERTAGLMETEFNHSFSLHPRHSNPDCVDMSESVSKVEWSDRHAVIGYGTVVNSCCLELYAAPSAGAITRRVR